MFHVEKIMFHAADGFEREIFDRLNMNQLLRLISEEGGARL
nr:hypothetical protein [uncultured Anaerosporobacter sp.]